MSDTKTKGKNLKNWYVCPRCELLGDDSHRDLVYVRKKVNNRWQFVPMGLIYCDKHGFQESFSRRLIPSMNDEMHIDADARKEERLLRRHFHKDGWNELRTLFKRKNDLLKVMARDMGKKELMDQHHKEWDDINSQLDELTKKYAIHYSYDNNLITYK